MACSLYQTAMCDSVASCSGFVLERDAEQEQNDQWSNDRPFACALHDRKKRGNEKERNEKEKNETHSDLALAGDEDHLKRRTIGT